MTIIRNDRDLLLSSALKRVEVAQGNTIVPLFSAPRFSVNNGVPTPVSITITTALTGVLRGIPTFSIVSGVSQINTAVPGECTIFHSHLTADTCVIRISLQYLGVTYSTDVSIEGRAVPPADVGTVIATPEAGRLRLSWPKNIESDIGGYEVRLADSGWGDNNFVYHGNSVTCLVDVAALLVNRTWFVRAFDSAGLFSLSSRSVSYTVQRPVAPTLPVSEFSNNSTTTSTVLISWTPVAPVFGLRHYRVLVTPPFSTSYERVVSNPSVILDAGWVGTASVVVFVVDILGNESGESPTLLVVKLLPSAPTVVNVSPSGTGLRIDWDEVSRTTLPVAGYELRRSNTLWGVQNSDFVWRGNVSEASVPNPAIGNNTFFLNTYDTDGKYSTTPRTVTYVVTRPPVPTGLIVRWNDTSTTSGTATFLWSPGVESTFAISRYRIRFVKPGRATEEALSDTTNWTVQADWLSTAEIRIWAIDVLGQESSTFASLIVDKTAPQAPTSSVVSTSGTNLIFSWPPAQKSTLPIYGYELRNNTGGWGSVDTGLEWRGTATSCTIPVGLRPLGINSFYLRSYDTDSVYSPTSLQLDVFITRPSSVEHVSVEYTNSTATGVSAIARWVPGTSMFALAHYLITINRPSHPDIIVQSLTNEYQFIVDWAGSANISIAAVDVLGNYSNATVVVLPKTPPMQPGVVTITPRNSFVELNWPDNARTSLPIAGYEMRSSDTGWGTGGHLWKGIASVVEVFSLPANSQTWFIRAFDTAGQYSDLSRIVSYAPTPPEAPLNVTGLFTTQLSTATAVFRWQPPVSIFNVARYNVSLVTTNPIRTITNVRDTTDWEVPADWLGNAVFSVEAVNVFNHVGPKVEFVLNKVKPAQPPEFLPISVSGTAIELDWHDSPRTSLPILGYELRTSDIGWGTTDFVWKGSSSSCLVDLKGVLQGSILTWFMRAFDADNRYSDLSRSITYSVQPPVNTRAVTHRFEDTNLTSASVILSWEDTSPIFGLKHYEIVTSLPKGTTTTANSNILTVTSSKGISIGDNATLAGVVPIGRKVTAILSNTTIAIDNGDGVVAGSGVATFSNSRFSNSTTISLPANWLGDKTFSVITVNMLGHTSTGISTVATKHIPKPATNFRAQVIDNTVLLFWGIPEVTTLPLAHATLKKGDTWDTAELIGNKDGSFSTVTELRAGTYTYWIALVDTDNNESEPIKLSAVVSQPPDYIFNREWSSTFSGTKVNALVDTASLILPVDTNESFEQHFTTRAWEGPFAQVAAGFPVYIQPGLSSGFYEEVFDYETILGSSQISLSLVGGAVVGTPSVEFVLSTSTDGVVYQDSARNTSSAFASNFRYIKVRVEVAQNTAGQLYRLNSLVVRLDAKQKTDSGMTQMSLGGAQPQGNLSVNYLESWIPGADMPPSQFILRGTAAEGFISLAPGPGGSLEPIWSCVDTDISGGDDGGWGNTAMLPISPSTGNMYAVFMQTPSASGISYWGPSENTSNILTIGGAVDNNPYFWFGDLPALNTWYLVVGYVHPTSYGTTVTAHSGIFALNGTKLVNGTDYKYAPGTTIMGHRSFNWSNTGGSGLVSQRMARPVILECSEANVPNMIQYLLTCATSFGSSVLPRAQFSDVISITATPQGISQRNPVVDFLDVPNPKHFNVFNFNQIGAPSDGNVSWTVRGY